MSNDSSTGGYLVPSVDANLDDVQLNRTIQAFLVGLTGLQGNLVRPMYQGEPPTHPKIDVNWIAFFIADRRPDTYSTQQFIDDLIMKVTRAEEFDVAVSFYGPNATNYSNDVRDGSQLTQNRDVLTALNIGFVHATMAVNAAYLNNQVYAQRVDTTLVFRRTVSRTYPIRSLLHAEAGIHVPDTIPPEFINSANV